MVILMTACVKRGIEQYDIFPVIYDRCIFSQEDILEKVEVFRELIKKPDKGKIVKALQVIIPAFTPDL